MSERTNEELANWLDFYASGRASEKAGYLRDAAARLRQSPPPDVVEGLVSLVTRWRQRLEHTVYLEGHSLDRADLNDCDAALARYSEWEKGKKDGSS